MKTFLPRMQSSPAPGQTFKIIRLNSSALKFQSTIKAPAKNVSMISKVLQDLSSTRSTFVQPRVEAFQVFANGAGFQLEANKTS